MVGAYADHTLTPAAQALDAASGGRLAAGPAWRPGDHPAARPAGRDRARVLVVGLGDAARFGVPQYLKAVGDAVRALKAGAVRTRCSPCPKWPSRTATRPGRSARQ